MTSDQPKPSMNNEAMEALVAKTAEELQAKVGKDAQVIVLVLDASNGSHQSRWIGRGVFLLWLLEIGTRAIKDALLPKTSRLP